MYINAFINLIYYMGITSCAAQGAEKGKSTNYVPVLHYITNAFGGGFVRDMFILGVYPWILTLSALPDLILVIITGFLYTCCFHVLKIDKKWYNATKYFVFITDSFGVGSFIFKGMEAAFMYDSNFFTTIVCGYITAIGGGVLASGKPLTIIFRDSKTVCYHLVTMLGCCYYYIYKNSFCLVCFVAIGLFLTNIDYRSLHSLFHCNIITAYPNIFMPHQAIYNKNNNLHDQKIMMQLKKGTRIYLVRPKLYLIQRRLRQC